MDKASIIRFSDTVRDKLLQETQRKAAYYGIFPDTIQDVDEEFEDSIVIGGRVFNKKIKQQREQLVKEVREKGYDQVIDEITYTWFNRFVALKFMEVNGYLPVKVFSSDESRKQEPDILTKSLKLDFLKIDRDTVIDLKSGGKDEELYKYLTLSLCNYLNDTMPFLFEPIEDYTELLFPGTLLHTDSILVDLNNIIKEDDWKEVEVIGWIYQDYINPGKDKVFANLKKNIKISKENIPAVTQLFTPKWIVKYLVENSVGRLWLELNPNKDLPAKFRYFIEQETRPPEKRILSPEEISILDPAMGSGHILVYAFKVLYEIYRSQGYLESEIAPLILNKNLYGLEIDDRAAQLAGFALMMKARMYDKELFNKKISLNLCAIQETREECALNRGKYPELCRLWEFFIDAKNYGSILKVEGFDFERMREEIDLLKKEETLDSFFVGSKLELLLKQAGLMGRKYDCVVTNPPYMGLGGMNSKLADFIKNQYLDSKKDLFAVFIEVCLNFTKLYGFTSMITMQSWMFLPSFEKLRIKILQQKMIDTMIHLGPRAFEQIGGEVVTTTAFVIGGNNGVFIRLIDYKNPGEKEIEFYNSKNKYHITNQRNFLKIPGTPIIYWVSDKLLELFDNYESLYEYTTSDGQTKSGNNDLYLKRIWEVEAENIDTINKWRLHPKGGGYRKWYGNVEWIIDWSIEAREHYRKDRVARILPEYLWDRMGFCWSMVSTGKTSFRLLSEGEIFNLAAPALFPKEDKYILIFLGFVNSIISSTLIKTFNPTKTNVGDVQHLPINPRMFNFHSDIEQIVSKCIQISKDEWDSRETSWDFTINELLRHKTSPHLEKAYNNYCAYWKNQFFKLHTNEEELNRIFIDTYDLADELTPDVPLEDITILKEESEIKDGELVFRKEVVVKQFISYAVGCMFGRYSPNKKGVILANQGETIDDFREKVPDASFIPDEDNIIPILEDEYFTDDIVSRFREFLKVTFRAEGLADNLEFIAGALSKSKKGGGSPEKVIRDYFLKSFFKDHVKMYKKRPIYWLFTSGKGRGFNALVYMHRYDRETLAKMRTDYLLELEAKLDARIGMLGDDSAAEKGKLVKRVEELMDYDAVLNNKALEYIDIDLDDGVKVNYAKFEGLVGKI